MHCLPFVNHPFTSFHLSIRINLSAICSRFLFISLLCILAHSFHFQLFFYFTSHYVYIFYLSYILLFVIYLLSVLHFYVLRYTHCLLSLLSYFLYFNYYIYLFLSLAFLHWIHPCIRFLLCISRLLSYLSLLFIHVFVYRFICIIFSLLLGLSTCLSNIL